MLAVIIASICAAPIPKKMSDEMIVGLSLASFGTLLLAGGALHSATAGTAASKVVTSGSESALASSSSKALLSSTAELGETSALSSSSANIVKDTSWRTQFSDWINPKSIALKSFGVGSKVVNKQETTVPQQVPNALNDASGSIAH
jgi:hypothetical protein